MGQSKRCFVVTAMLAYIRLWHYARPHWPIHLKEETAIARLFAGLVVAVSLTAAPGVARADFPEQPGDNPQTACAALIFPNNGTITAFGQGPNADGRASATAEQLAEALLIDVCYGG